MQIPLRCPPWIVKVWNLDAAILEPLDGALVIGRIDFDVYEALGAKYLDDGDCVLAHWRFPFRSDQCLKGEGGLAAGLHVGGAIARRVTLAAQRGPLEETGTVIAKPAVLDAEDHSPSLGLGA